MPEDTLTLSSEVVGTDVEDGRRVVFSWRKALLEHDLDIGLVRDAHPSGAQG
jgi:hypothetical protein